MVVSILERSTEAGAACCSGVAVAAGAGVALAQAAGESPAAAISVGRVALAALVAAIAASSLLVGAALGVFSKPSQRVVAVVMAFGSGALIQALAVELAFEGAERLTRDHLFSPAESWLWVATGFILGGYVYHEANRVIEKRGGHLRKPARMKAFLFEHYGRFPMIHINHPDWHLHLAAHLRVPGDAHLPAAAHLAAGVQLPGHGHNPAAAAPANPMDPMPLQGEVPPSEAGPASMEINAMPLVAEDHSAFRHGAEQALAKAHGESAPVAIFMGALLDGIPESVVIGAGFITLANFSPTFVVAVFLSNLPEAMSSAAGMTRAGFAVARIFMLWGSLVLASAVAAALGNAFLIGAPPTVLTFVEAVAGGGILAMLASTMMPEAYEHGGPMVGLATIAGFLSAFFFTALKMG